MSLKKIRIKKEFLLATVVLIIAAGVGITYMGQKNNIPVDNVEMEPMDKIQYSKMTIDMDTTYQTIESFGTSGAWWSQYVGGWDQPYKEGQKPVRDEIAELLFDKETGIGLTSYRYNIGAGSTSGKSIIQDPDRRAQSFEVAPFEYDWSKDKNAVWFLDKAVELGVEEVTLFCNSPLERLTVSGMAHVGEKGVSNLDPENYDDFARYVLDVTEHFVEKGIPVKFLSPINEPQWDWTGGQEGAHYETKEIVDIYKVFINELEKRESLKDVELSGPESGEWGGKTKEYVGAILKDELLKEHFKTIDNHSYWTEASTKKDFKQWMDINFPGIKLRMSEWCEMVNGTDFTMDSGFNLAEEVLDDLTILDVVSWQTWVGIAPGNYRDGLIYVSKDKKAYRPAKRLYTYGNFTKFVRPGYQRIDVKHNYKDLYDLKTVAFKGDEEVVLVVINRGEERNFQLDLGDVEGFNAVSVYTTTEEKDLLCTYEDVYTKDTVINLEAESVSTIVLSKKGGTEMSEYAGYLFCYFTGEERTLQDEQVYFAISKDGLHWTDLNDGKPVLQSQVGEGGVRDPFILRMENENKYIIIATDLQIAKGTSWGEAVTTGSTNLVIWESEDLINWSEPRLYDTGVQTAGCAWAPEVIYDESTDDYMVFWASMTYRSAQKKHRIYCSRTKDFKTFTEPELYMERDQAVIDTTIIRANDMYYRFSKDESSKHIIMEKGKTLDKANFVQCEAKGLDQLEGVEGPIIFKAINEEKWYLLVDTYQKGEGYLPLVTTDLEKGEFTVLPSHAYDFGKLKKRHGSVMYLTHEEWSRLQ